MKFQTLVILFHSAFPIPILKPCLDITISPSYKAFFFFLFYNYRHSKTLWCSTYPVRRRLDYTGEIACGGFWFMLTSLYSYFYDKSVNGKPDTLSIVSYAAIASMSLCFSRKIELGFEMEWNWRLGIPICAELCHIICHVIPN